MITAEATIALLHDVIPNDWKNKDVVSLGAVGSTALSTDWLEAVWTFLRAHYPGDLSCVTGLPLLPLEGADACRVVPLRLPSNTMLLSVFGTELPEAVAQLLTDMGEWGHQLSRDIIMQALAELHQVQMSHVYSGVCAHIDHVCGCTRSHQRVVAAQACTWC